jgi:esterase/lipase
VTSSALSSRTDPEINEQKYEWGVRIFDRLKHLLGVNIKLHHEQGQVEAGDIFLFNHFARMETFIPQYLIFHESGAFCRSVAAHQFFEGNEAFAKLLMDVGALPNNYPRLLPLLAENVLRGRKIVVFPEGGMVKDRRVVDERGEFSIYSRTAATRRKHHTGAARLAIGLAVFKQAVLIQDRRGDRELLQRWTEAVGLESRYALIEAARKPVGIVPANITFYPLRVGENALLKGVELFNRNLSDRIVEELIVEGNLLLRATDMDIRLGDLIAPESEWRWWERAIIGYLVRRVRRTEDIFDLGRGMPPRDQQMCALGLRASIERLRDRYMEQMYRSVTVNLSHLASHVILASLDRGQSCLPMPLFRTSLYLAIKRLQGHAEIHLHRGLCDPAVYAELLERTTEPLAQLLRSATETQLIEIKDDVICFMPKLSEEHAFDEIRIENPIEVYANEVRPLGEVITGLGSVLDEAAAASRRDLALLRFDDERAALKWAKFIFSKPRYQEINQHETATAAPDPFLFRPENPRRIGVLLVHGLLASPAEVRDFGEKLSALGYTVLGLRLRGHGTSPWDLRETTWEDWLESVKRGFAILRELADEVCCVGFSTGGALSLVLASESPVGLRGVVAVCTAIKYKNRNMRFVPLMHGANRIVRWLSSYEGIMPFRPNQSEHPHINYRNVPIRALYELTQLNDKLKKALKQITCPVTLIQATDDQVVDPDSANTIYDLLKTEDKRLFWVESKRHGILHEDIGETHQHIIELLSYLEIAAAVDSDEQPVPAAEVPSGS